MEFKIQGIIDGWVYFELPAYVIKGTNGPSRIAVYRTDGNKVEGKNLSSWSETGSLPVIIVAREAFKLAYHR